MPVAILHALGRRHEAGRPRPLGAREDALAKIISIGYRNCDRRENYIFFLEAGKQARFDTSLGEPTWLSLFHRAVRALMMIQEGKEAVLRKTYVEALRMNGYCVDENRFPVQI